MRIHVGIDIGTSSTKICARKGERIIYESKSTYPDDVDHQNSGIQNTKMILKTAMEVLKTCKGHLESEKIDDVWVCGQMHGIVMWNQKSMIFGNIDSLICSPLYNWTYTTPTTPNFLKTLPIWSDGVVHPGFGIATLAELFHNDPESLKAYTNCGTIMDLFVTFLTSSADAFISHQNAHSWGYCTSSSSSEFATWQSEIADFLPEWIHLPTVIQEGTVVGSWHGAKCHVACGDLQASVASLDVEGEKDVAFVILGTSAQLCCLVPRDKIPPTVPPTVVQLPYSSSRRLLAACSMNGGNALEAVLRLQYPEGYCSQRLVKWLEELDGSAPNPPGLLQIDPIFIEERGISKNLKISGLSSETSELELLEATHSGIVRNLFSLFSESLLQVLKIRKLALIGAAQSPRFKRHIEEQFPNFELTIPSSPISTPFGATKF